MLSFAQFWMASFFSVKNVIIVHGLNAIMFEVLDVIICECTGSGANSFKWYHFPGTYFVSIYVIIWWLSFFTVSRCYPFLMCHVEKRGEMITKKDNIK